MFIRERMILEKVSLPIVPAKECFTMEVITRCRMKQSLANEKLALLQAGDGYREWKALTDKRVCILCEQTFSGSEVVVKKGRHGIVQLRCPTEGCSGTPEEWVFPGNPLTSDESWNDWLRILDDLSLPEAAGSKLAHISA
jgi:hypothetical protein